MKCNSISNSSFNAKISGDFAKIYKISKENGLSKRAAKSMIEVIHKCFPDKQDTVKFYKKELTGNIGSDSYKTIRINKIKVIRNHSIKGEISVPLKHVNPKDYLEKYLSALQVLANQIKKRSQ